MPMRDRRPKKGAAPPPRRPIQIRVALPPEIHDWLEAEADRQDRTVQGAVRQLVRERYMASLPTPT